VVRDLFDRQARLVEHLTSSLAIFAEGRGAQLDPALQGLDPGLLHLEANLSHEKRISKIVAVLPRTFGLLGDERAAIVREFTDACPPADIGFIENARQFHGFLCSRQERQSVKLPYLHEVAACELAMADVRVLVQDQRDVADSNVSEPVNSIRRRPGIVLLRCTYDIRPIFVSDADGVSPSKRDTPLAISIAPGAQHPTVFELAPAVFDLLSTISDWSECEALGTAAELKELISELTACGLVEARP
jgi:hypothetical protein